MRIELTTKTLQGFFACLGTCLPKIQLMNYIQNGAGRGTRTPEWKNSNRITNAVLSPLSHPGINKLWSERGDSNPRSSLWKSDARPLGHARKTAIQLSKNSRCVHTHPIQSLLTYPQFHPSLRGYFPKQRAEAPLIDHSQQDL